MQSAVKLDTDLEEVNALYHVYLTFCRYVNYEPMYFD